MNIPLESLVGVPIVLKLPFPSKMILFVALPRAWITPLIRNIIVSED